MIAAADFALAVLIILLMATAVQTLNAQSSRPSSFWLARESALQQPQYILAGGQYGAWFEPVQDPSLVKVSLGSSSNNLTTTTTLLAADPNAGTVWSGGWNGTEWLITGWGWGDTQGLNPYVDLYNSSASGEDYFQNYTQADTAELEWAGGDVFSVSWNGSVWLLSGMGSGILPPNQKATNHMSLGLLYPNGTFVDLTSQIPNNQDAILYSSGWNGHYWLVGGGWYGFGIGALYMYSGGTITDITNAIAQAIPSFDAIQSMAWNGQYWLIGGVGFLAKFDGKTFTDLTQQLNAALGADSLYDGNTNAVNSIVWTGHSWMLAGGVPVAYDGGSNQGAWVASYNPSALNSKAFSDLTSNAIPPALASSDSSVLSMACAGASCALGGFSGNQATLFLYNTTLSQSTDLSGDLPAGMNYVQWVGFTPTASHLALTASHLQTPSTARTAKVQFR